MVASTAFPVRQIALMFPPARAVPLGARVETLPYRPHFWHGKKGDAVFAIAFLLVNALLQVLDAGATWLGLKLGGTEVNPLMALLLSTPGPALFFAFKAVVIMTLVAWAVWIAWRKEATPGMLRGIVALALGFALIVAVNVAIISKHVYGLALY